jgi:hypothetical protein
MRTTSRFCEFHPHSLHIWKPWESSEVGKRWRSLGTAPSSLIKVTYFPKWHEFIWSHGAMLVMLMAWIIKIDTSWTVCSTYQGSKKSASICGHYSYPQIYLGNKQIGQTNIKTPQPPSSTQGARRSSKILVPTYKTARHHIPENNKLYIKHILQNSPGTETLYS